MRIRALEGGEKALGKWGDEMDKVSMVNDNLRWWE